MALTSISFRLSTAWGGGSAALARAILRSSSVGIVVPWGIVFLSIVPMCALIGSVCSVPGGWIGTNALLRAGNCEQRWPCDTAVQTHVPSLPAFFRSGAMPPGCEFMMLETS